MLALAQPPGRVHSGKSARLSSGTACLPEISVSLDLTQFPRESAARFSRENRFTLFLELLELMRSDGIADGVLHRATIHWAVEACQPSKKKMLCSASRSALAGGYDRGMAWIIAGRGGRFSTWEESKC